MLPPQHFDAAAETFLEADKVLRAAFSADHIYVADALNACGEAFAEARRYHEVRRQLGLHVENVDTINDRIVCLCSSKFIVKIGS